METGKPASRLSWTEMLDILTNSDKKRKTVIERATETERTALFFLRREGWSAQISPEHIKDYNIELSKNSEKVAVQISNNRSKINLGQIEKFVDFLSQSSSKHFSQGFFISSSGFTPSVYAFLREEKNINLRLGILKNERLIWNPELIEPPNKKKKPTYIGVFTCKGGVGKTTISAHLAGAFALNGYDVALIDLDHQQNLRKLLGEEVYLPATKGKFGSNISIYNQKEWSETNQDDKKIVICDCNPEFDANPVEFIRKFDYCLIPTTLNPLGVNKNADVIKRTFEAIRVENKRVELFVLINNFFSDEENRNEFLNQILKSQFKQMTEKDKRSHYIDPFESAIRFSKHLLYWGLHVFDGSTPSLAFRSKGGRSYPRTDFLKLVDYLESHTEIQPTAINQSKFLM
jgi:chromosome partitioning protein